MTDALIIVDAQKKWAEDNPLTTKRIADAVESLRGNMKIVWVNMAAPGTKIQAPRILNAGTLTHLFANVQEGYQPQIAPQANDIWAQKSQMSGFKKTDLGNYLKQNKVENIYCTGFLSSLCVFETAADGAQMGFNSYIVTDLTADYFDEVFFLNNNAVDKKMDKTLKAKNIKLLSSLDL